MFDANLVNWAFLTVKFVIFRVCHFSLRWCLPINHDLTLPFPSSCNFPPHLSCTSSWHATCSGNPFLMPCPLHAVCLSCQSCTLLIRTRCFFFNSWWRHIFQRLSINDSEEWMTECHATLSENEEWHGRKNENNDNSNYMGWWTFTLYFVVTIRKRNITVIAKLLVYDRGRKKEEKQGKVLCSLCPLVCRLYSFYRAALSWLCRI